MEKFYKSILALVLCALGAMNVNAEERVPLTTDMFFSWDGWDQNAQKIGPADCAYQLNEPTGQPYGDPSVINYADLSLYSKLILTVTDGTPRFLFNRDVDEGQWNENEAESHLIDNTRNGWSAKYFFQDGETFTVDLKQMVKDKGFAHLHSIKGANWANVTVTSMELVREGKAQVVGWTDLITNGDLEGDDVSCFYSKENGGEPFPSVITDGVGVDGSRGIQVHSAAGAAQDWDAQFWINVPETLPEGTKYRISFAYRASIDASADTQAHADPSDYIHYEMIGSPNFTTEWQVYNIEGTITAQQAGPNGTGGLMHSIAFNLSKDRVNDVDFFFDNIKFEVYKYGTIAEFSEDVIQLDFGFETNVIELAKASGKRRLLYPTNCVNVRVNGETRSITSVEGFDDGRFYVFLDEGTNEDDLVEVSFTNPTDPTYHLVYTSGPGGDVPNFSGEATYNFEIPFHEKDDVYPYAYLTPAIMKADPEDGSFNLPNSIKEFKVTFDKPADCAALVATLNNQRLTVSPAQGFAEEITLTRTSSEDLATDAYELHITKIYPEMRLDDSIYGDTIYTINVGKVNIDPNDVPADLLPDYFAQAGSGTIPEGWLVMFGQEERPSQSSHGSGSRMFDFSAGGDFTKGLYFREGYAEYGSTVGYPLTLEGGKRYTISFNTAMWKDNGNKTRFEVMNSAGEVVFVQVVNNTPNVNGGTGAVNGSAKHSFKFTPDASGNYVVRWTSSASETGDPAYMEIILANPQVKYIPNVAGVEETQALMAALEAAKSTFAANGDERYSGSAYTALDEAIKKYEAEYPGYTAPTAYKNATAALEAVTQAMKDHRTYCDNYDDQIKKSIDVVRDYAETKYAVTDLYAQLKATNEKYHAYSEWVANPEFDGEVGDFIYHYDVLTDDAALVEAADELANAVKVAGYMFTEGESKTSSDVGIKVLVDRIRQGVEGLKQLGVAEDDPLIVRANNAVTDDDALVEEIKNRIKVEYYGKMKDGVNMFEEIVDENTLESSTPTYNFTVFVKNPNTYAWKESAGVNEENCPGWTMIEGNAGLTNMWNGGYPGDIDGLPKDLCITQYHQTNRIEQTIEDLPAGVYTVMIDAAEWSDEFTPGENDDEEAIATKEANHEMNRVYVKTSDTPAYEEGMESEAFAADARIDHHGQYVGRYENFLTDVVVVDGVLTIGVKWNNLAQFMFDRVQVFLANPAANFDYASAYNEVILSIDDAVARPASVRAIELYDLNGCRITKAGKGVVIMKKHMSDGTIVTEKVIRK